MYIEIEAGNLTNWAPSWTWRLLSKSTVDHRLFFIINEIISNSVWVLCISNNSFSNVINIVRIQDKQNGYLRLDSTNNNGPRIKTTIWHHFLEVRGLHKWQLSCCHTKESLAGCLVTGSTRKLSRNGSCHSNTHMYI